MLAEYKKKYICPQKMTNTSATYFGFYFYFFFKKQWGRMC